MEEFKNAKLAFWRSLEHNGWSSMSATSRPRKKNWEEWALIFIGMEKLENIGNTDS
ncbi:hypothetical protein FH972_009869 [Carpinus fangiana]|uniref:Uncharacterized protein n=1 Tax=Carpinus fangiana TaxID=176857 RepID=A0A660KPA5_9ROSI|nr:hypothetical protein FH972_009869 [Carpinus fangiana]